MLCPDQLFTSPFSDFSAWVATTSLTCCRLQTDNLQLAIGVFYFFLMEFLQFFQVVFPVHTTSPTLRSPRMLH